MEERIQDGLLRGLAGFYPGSELLQRFGEHIQSLVEAAERTAEGGDPERHLAALLALEAVLLSDLLSEPEAREVVHRAELQGAMAASQRLFADFECRLEDAFVADIARVRHPLRYLNDCESETRSYLARYRALAAAEIALAGIGPEDRVAFVGAGCLPITALEYVRTRGCRVDAIEILRDRAAQAGEIIEHLGLSDRLQVVAADGGTVDFAGYSVILVGVLAEPKSAIFARIAGSAAADARVLCRTTEGLRQFIYRPTAPRSLLPYEAQAISRARGFQTLSTLCLGKVSLKPEGAV
ncbi:nicotianamine synthase family protein [Pelagibius sp.]|uniref:nicotianamine synthase family protein n=1 Tax=Pelagibius sp. TaxID=1931238 RepID=UPI003B5140AA